jgi:hypothetical protein
VIERLGRALLGLLRGAAPLSATAPSNKDRDWDTAERLEAARRRLKETIPPPEDE